jgi:hypothetical protein
MPEKSSTDTGTDNSAPEITNQVSIDPKSGTEETSKEIGGREGLNPTRYGDWEKAGRCIDF